MSDSLPSIENLVTPVEEPLLIPDDVAAAELRLDFGDLEQAMRRGDIPSSRQGRFWFIQRPWMEAYRNGEVELPAHVKELQFSDEPEVSVSGTADSMETA